MPNTREKLIELLGESLRYSGDYCGEIGNCKKCQYDKDGDNCGYAVRADYFIANGVTVQKWIPVTERLPDKNGEYLCRWVNKSVSDAEYESTYGSFGYWFNFWEDEYKEWISYDGITHWMALPEPPKGE